VAGVESKVELKMVAGLQVALLVCLLVYVAFLGAQFTWFLVSPQSDVIVLPDFQYQHL